MPSPLHLTVSALTVVFSALSKMSRRSFMTAREILDDLPESVAEACSELFAKHPIEEAMAALVVHKGQEDFYSLVETAIESPAFQNNPYLVAGIWLYVDELHKSHVISQGLHDPTGSLWHAIMHRREGDFWNSKYWLRSAGRHESCADIDGYNSVKLVDMAENSDPQTAEVQRTEWAALFVWCALHLP